MRANVSAIAARLADGRVHLAARSIDLINVRAARGGRGGTCYGQAVDRFGDILHFGA